MICRQCLKVIKGVVKSFFGRSVCAGCFAKLGAKRSKGAVSP